MWWWGGEKEMRRWKRIRYRNKLCKSRAKIDGNNSGFSYRGRQVSFLIAKWKRGGSDGREGKRETGVERGVEGGR